MKTFNQLLQENLDTFAVEVITDQGVGGYRQMKFDSLEDAKKMYPGLDPFKNGQTFTSAMDGGRATPSKWGHNKKIMRFEDWNVYNQLSR